MENDQLFLAAIKIGTQALGPGIRAAIWVQGCPFHCVGCIAPDWITPGNVSTNIKDIADRILDDPRITGLTISGGEPMMQARSLVNLLRILKVSNKNFDVICFTGFTYKKLLSKLPSPEVLNFLEEIDVLIDGPYIVEKNDNSGLRGSSNQTIHYLSGRLSEYDFEHGPRKIEVDVSEGEAFIVGIPPKYLIPAWDQAMNSILGEI